MMVGPTDSIQVHGRRFQPSDLVELPAVEAKASGEQLESLFLRRRSIRHFSSADVPCSFEIIPLETHRSIICTLVHTVNGQQTMLCVVPGL